MKARLLLTTVLSALFMTTLVSLSNAQVDFPTKPIQIVVAQPPGGSTDILIRALVQDAKNYL